MFGSHKKHDVLTLKEGAMFIRREIDKGMSTVLLKKETSESKILSIRENGLIIEKSKTETVQKIENSFKGLVHCLKARRDFLINEINEKFNEQRQKIEEAETDWCYKEDITEKLLQFYNDKNNSFLLANSKFIMEGLRKLNEKLTFTELEVYNNIGTDLVIELPLKPIPTNNEGNNGSKSNVPSQGNNLETEGSVSNGEQGNNKTYSLDDIIDAFSNYMTLGPPNVLDYKA